MEGVGDGLLAPALAGVAGADWKSALRFFRYSGARLGTAGTLSFLLAGFADLAVPAGFEGAGLDFRFGVDFDFLGGDPDVFFHVDGGFLDVAGAEGAR